MSETLTFNSRGNQLRGTLARSLTKKGAPQPVVLMATGDGLSGSRSRTWSDFRSALDAKGLSSFVFDFQGLGESDGEARKLSLSVGLENMRDAVAFLRSIDFVDPNAVAILGSSFGGNVALLYAAEDPAISGLALKSPVSFYPEVHEREFGISGLMEWKQSGFSESYGYEYGFYTDSLGHNTYQAASKVVCPVKIVHGDSDRNVPHVQSLRLMEVLEDANLELLPGVDHDYAQGDAREVMTDKLVTWLWAHFRTRIGGN